MEIFADELEKVGDERLARETERLFEYLEDEENKNKQARTGEDNGDSKPSASSSGPEVAKEAVPRSRGGVPMALDSGDSLQETVKRKSGDGEHEESEDMREKKSKTGKERRGVLTIGRSWQQD